MADNQNKHLSRLNFAPRKVVQQFHFYHAFQVWRKKVVAKAGLRSRFSGGHVVSLKSRGKNYFNYHFCFAFSTRDYSTQRCFACLYNPRDAVPGHYL